MSAGQYTHHLFPWEGVKASVGTVSQVQQALAFGLGYLTWVTPALNNEVSWDIWLDAGTWKIATVHGTYTDRGVVSIQIDGVTVATIDEYSASLIWNVYTETTGISVTTAGVHTIKIKMAAKNASATDYGMLDSSIALIRTGGTGATGTSSDAPGSTVILIPWMGTKAETGGNWTRQQSSTYLGGGYYQGNGGPQNDSVSWDVWLDAGTYKVALERATDANIAITTVRFNGVDVATIDGYSASLTPNVYTEVTGITVTTAGVVTVTLIAATKNGASTNYVQRLQSLALIKTA